MSTDSEGLHIDELVASTTSSYNFETPSNQLNVLSKSHKFTLDIIQQIEDPVKKKNTLKNFVNLYKKKLNPVENHLHFHLQNQALTTLPPSSKNMIRAKP